MPPRSPALALSTSASPCVSAQRRAHGRSHSKRADRFRVAQRGGQPVQSMKIFRYEAAINGALVTRSLTRASARMISGADQGDQADQRMKQETHSQKDRSPRHVHQRRNHAAGKDLAQRVDVAQQLNVMRAARTQGLPERGFKSLSRKEAGRSGFRFAREPGCENARVPRS